MGKNFYEMFKTEDNLEVDGVWKEYGGVLRVKLARAGNKNVEFNKALGKAAKKYKDAGTDTKVDQERPWAEVYSKSIVKAFEVKVDDEWVSGVYLPNESGDVELMDATKENIMRVFLDLPDLFDKIKEDAAEMRTFQKEEEEEEAKN